MSLYNYENALSAVFFVLYVSGQCPFRRPDTCRQTSIDLTSARVNFERCCNSSKFELELSVIQLLLYNLTSASIDLHVKDSFSVLYDLVM